MHPSQNYVRQDVYKKDYGISGESQTVSGLVGNNIAKERAAIDQETSFLAGATEELHQMLNILEEALSPILRGDEPTVQNSQPADPSSGSSPLYYRLTDTRMNIEAGLRKISRLRSRIEI